MKPSIYLSCLILLALLSACNEPQETTTSSISFSIEGYGSDTIRLYQFEHLGTDPINTHKLIVDESGSGILGVAFPDNSYVRVQIADYTFSIFHTPCANLRIEGQLMDLPNTLTISGEGSLPINYTLAKDSIIHKFNTLDGRDFLQLDSLEFWARMKALNKEMDSLNTWLITENIDPELESLLILESQQQANAFILLYALVKRYTDPKYSIEIPYDENLFMSFSSSYSMVLALNYERKIIRSAWESSGASNSDSIANIFPIIFWETIHSLEIPEFAKDFYISRMLISYFGENMSSPAVEEVYAHWLRKYPQSIFKNTISKMIESMSSLTPGLEAPIIKGIDSNGNDFTIEELRGQVIYIDVWATWCSGCVEKIPKMHALQEEFKNQNLIQFLFVSVDKDLDKWKNYILKLPDGGMHINAYNKGLYQDYMMGGIPHYILIDASGKIIQSNAPDPDSKEIRSVLNEAIKQAANTG
ncbi:MAG: TlpA disulfide reductase family protein [Bacteroidota bacterium]|nr:TlpA disulfide reductase family protein [Bacteroidota bacterium]